MTVVTSPITRMISADRRAAKWDESSHSAAHVRCAAVDCQHPRLHGNCLSVKATHPTPEPCGPSGLVAAPRRQLLRHALLKRRAAEPRSLPNPHVPTRPMPRPYAGTHACPENAKWRPHMRGPGARTSYLKGEAALSRAGGMTSPIRYGRDLAQLDARNGREMHGVTEPPTNKVCARLVATQYIYGARGRCVISVMAIRPCCCRFI
jgi:hypothetical protein